MVKSVARSALILAIGLCAAFAAPSAARDSGRAAINGTQPATARAPAGQVAIVTDRLTAADRALRDPGASSPPPAVATAALTSAAPATATTAGTAPGAASVTPASAATSGGHSLWGKTSLIGKIFVGIGAVLTLASAARMFMA